MNIEIKINKEELDFFEEMIGTDPDIWTNEKWKNNDIVKKYPDVANIFASVPSLGYYSDFFEIDGKKYIAYTEFVKEDMYGQTVIYYVENEGDIQNFIEDTFSEPFYENFSEEEVFDSAIGEIRIKKIPV